MDSFKEPIEILRLKNVNEKKDRMWNSSKRVIKQLKHEHSFRTREEKKAPNPSKSINLH